MAVNIMTNTMMMATTPSSSLPPHEKICSPMTEADQDSLICDEILDLNELNTTPECSEESQRNLSALAMSAESLPPTVMAISDPGQLNDSR